MYRQRSVLSQARCIMQAFASLMIYGITLALATRARIEAVALRRAQGMSNIRLTGYKAAIWVITLEIGVLCWIAIHDTEHQEHGVFMVSMSVVLFVSIMHTIAESLRIR